MEEKKKISSRPGERNPNPTPHIRGYLRILGVFAEIPIANPDCNRDPGSLERTRFIFGDTSLFQLGCTLSSHHLPYLIQSRNPKRMVNCQAITKGVSGSSNRALLGEKEACYNAVSVLRGL